MPRWPDLSAPRRGPSTLCGHLQRLGALAFGGNRHRALDPTGGGGRARALFPVAGAGGPACESCACEGAPILVSRDMSAGSAQPTSPAAAADPNASPRLPSRSLAGSGRVGAGRRGGKVPSAQVASPGEGARR